MEHKYHFIRPNQPKKRKIFISQNKHSSCTTILGISTFFIILKPNANSRKLHEKTNRKESAFESKDESCICPTQNVKCQTKRFFSFLKALTAYKNKELPPKTPAMLFYLSSTTRHFSIYLDRKTRKENGHYKCTNLRI